MAYRYTPLQVTGQNIVFDIEDTSAVDLEPNLMFEMWDRLSGGAVAVTEEPDVGLTVDYFTTGEGGELVSTLRVARVPPDALDAWAAVIYSVEITDIETNDLLIVTVDFEVTNNHSSVSPGIWNYLVLGADVTAKTGINITDTAGHNVTPAMHHGFFSRSTLYLAGQDLGNQYLNLVAYAGSTSSISAMTVEQGYGRITAARFRTV